MTGTVVAADRFGEVPTIEKRVQAHLEDGTADLHMCLNAWALRRRFVNKQTGEVKRFRCDLWTCGHCGPYKVNLWRQLIAQAEPTHHLTLTKAGKTVEEAGRALTTFMQALRRGSKGRGRNRVGAREAYPIEYLAVLEEHEDFEENGFHWHILLKSDEDIPYEEVIKPLWTSAVFGKSRQHLRKTVIDKRTGEVKQEERLGWIKRVKNNRAIGYVTKYLMKEITRQRKGVRHVERCMLTGFSLNEDERLVPNHETVQETVTSRARRIRYSRGFFPESTKVLRLLLFAPASQPQEGVSCGDGEQGEAEHPAQEEMTERQEWEIKEIAPPCKTPEAYYALLRYGLTETIEDYVASGKRLSRRVVTLWNYHRTQIAASRWDGWVDLSASTCEAWCGRPVLVPRSDGSEVIGLVMAASPSGEVVIGLPDDEETGEAGEIVTISVRDFGSDEWLIVRQIVGC